jgi:2-keto-3-deoxy-6-phosphogluconate aldolase
LHTTEGGKFALSPLNPIGFIDECHRVGLLAVPAGYTSNELWDMKRQGAQMLKMFHAGLVGPKILKSMLGVSPLAAMNIMPSGGCSPDNAKEWLDAGASIIGMGSNLAGSDINHPYDSEAYKVAKAKWDESGAATAKKLFEFTNAYPYFRNL